MRNDHASMVFAESTSYIVKGGQVKNLFGGDERKIFRTHDNEKLT